MPSLPSLAVLLLAQQPVTFDEMLQKHAGTVGGPVATRIPDLRIDGTLQVGDRSGTFTFAWVSPERFHFRWQLGDRPGQQTWVGDSGWAWDGSAIAPLSLQDVFLAPWLFALTAPRRSAVVGSTTDSLVIVERETAFGRRDHFTVDRASGRIVRVATPLPGGDSVVARLSEFQTRQIFQMPHRIDASGPFGTWVLKDLQYRLAGGVSSELFRRPGAPVDTAWRAEWLAPAPYEKAVESARGRGAAERAAAAFQAGQWTAFLDALAEGERADPSSPALWALRGRRLLVEHRIAEALPVLRMAAASDATAAADLATALFHAGRLGEASRWVLKTRPERAGYARMLAAVGDSAYQVRWPRGVNEVVVPFLKSDPLPVVEVAVNGRKRSFFIDTGASVVFLFPDVARELGLQMFEGAPGTYAFGSRVQTDHAVLDSLTLGGVTISRLPAAVREFEGLREQFGQPDLAGILPVGVFARFLTTMDFPGARLVLRPRTAATAIPSAVRVPFLMLGDHYLVVPGRVNGGEPLWFFLDTGFTAGGFLAPKRTLVRSGVVKSAAELEGTSALTIDRLEVGPVVAERVASRSLVFPETLESSTGFRIGGLVSKTFLAPYRVTWDFERREIVFER